MAANNISAAIAHLRILGWSQTRNSPYHTYRHPTLPGMIQYVCGEWKPRYTGDKDTTADTIDLLNEITMRPNRPHNKKLTICEAMLRVAGFKQRKKLKHIWANNNDISIWHMTDLHQWTCLSANWCKYKTLVNALNKVLKP